MTDQTNLNQTTAAINAALALGYNDWLGLAEDETASKLSSPDGAAWRRPRPIFVYQALLISMKRAGPPSPDPQPSSI